MTQWYLIKVYTVCALNAIISVKLINTKYNIHPSMKNRLAQFETIADKTVLFQYICKVVGMIEVRQDARFIITEEL